MTITIYHNPACGTSRNVLAILRAAGYEPTVIEYLKTGWTRAKLEKLLASAGLSAREALRTTKSPAKEMGLMEPGVSDLQILEAMVKEPVLVNRPIVVTPKGTKLCRPSETVLEIMDRMPPETMTKEDGSPIVAR